jgi:hypothetical protein
MSVDYKDANECRCEAMRIDDQIVELMHQARGLRDRAAFLDRRDATNPTSVCGERDRQSPQDVR